MIGGRSTNYTNNPPKKGLGRIFGYTFPETQIGCQVRTVTLIVKLPAYGAGLPADLPVKRAILDTQAVLTPVTGC